jgi:predicted RNA binding protein YcfA (HicA-like mRNA interferase family)
MKAKELIKLLRENGWKLERIRGSHHIFFRNGKTVSVPVHGNRDIPTGTLSIILKQADLK